MDHVLSASCSHWTLLLLPLKLLSPPRMVGPHKRPQAKTHWGHPVTSPAVGYLNTVRCLSQDSLVGPIPTDPPVIWVYWGSAPSFSDVFYDEVYYQDDQETEKNSHGHADYFQRFHRSVLWGKTTVNSITAGSFVQYLVLAVLASGLGLNCIASSLL